MSQSMSSPWIRDYFMDVAETYGAQLFNTPVSLRKKKVQLTDFLTYQEDSYVWAWISDKDHRISVRISKDAADLYKIMHGRKIIDCRFSVVSITSYRPMFSPRPLSPNATGNTPVSHISLEVDNVRSVGVGGHLFGDPHDLESDENMKEWVLGLRQDGGGGNVLKLRKQQQLVQNQEMRTSPQSPPPFSLYAPVSQHQATKPLEDTTKPKPEQPQDFRRVYTKRWRIVEAHPWKFATKPVAQERPTQTESTEAPTELRLDASSRLESCDLGPFVCPTPPRRTPSPTSRPQQQGTPTDWSPSNIGSPVAPDKATTTALGNGTQDEPDALPTTPHLPSDAEGHTTADTAITADARSLPPPTPAQRIRKSPPSRYTSPRGSPEVLAPSSPLRSRQFPCSSPPPSSSLPLSSSSLLVPMNIRKNIQRKVPHPGLPVPRPDPTMQGPVQILVPNSDTSGTGSSQSYSQPQPPPQSKRQLLSHSPAFPSSLAEDFKPSDASTPKEGMPGSSTRRTSKISAESLCTHRDADELASTLTDEKYATEKPEALVAKQEESNSTRPPASNAPTIEVLEVGTSDTEEEADQLELTRTSSRTEVDPGTRTIREDTTEGGADADNEDDRPSADKVGACSGPRGSPLGRSTSRSPMHSLFSDLPGDERTVLPVSQSQDKIRTKASLTNVPRHDPESWKEPSFLAKNKGKGKAGTVVEPDTKRGKKRRRSAQSESLEPMRSKVTMAEVHAVTPGQIPTANVLPRDIEAPTNGKTHASHRSDTTETIPSAAYQLPKPLLANFGVDLEKVDLGKRVPIPMVDMEMHIKGTLLKTGRIRTLGEAIEENGNVYLMK